MFEGTDWLKVLTDIGAIERNSKNHPVHWVMSSGRHSDLRIDMWKLYANPVLYSKACRDLLKRARYRFGGRKKPTWFFGPDRGGILMAFELARQSAINAGFAYKNQGGWKIHGNELPKAHETVALCDDVLTTGGSIVGTCRALGSGTCLIGDPVFTFVNRSRMPDLCLSPDDGRAIGAYFNWHPIIALVEIKEPGWEPHECPLCKAGRAMTHE